MGRCVVPELTFVHGMLANQGGSWLLIDALVNPGLRDIELVRIKLRLIVTVDQASEFVGVASLHSCLKSSISLRFCGVARVGWCDGEASDDQIPCGLLVHLLPCRMGRSPGVYLDCLACPVEVDAVAQRSACQGWRNHPDLASRSRIAQAPPFAGLFHVRDSHPGRERHLVGLTCDKPATDRGDTRMALDQSE